MAPLASDVTAGTNATIAHYNNLRADVNRGLKTNTTVAYSGTVNFDLSLGNVFTVTCAGNPTFTVSNATIVDQFFMVIVIQDATGSRIPTWFSTIKWPNNVVPTFTVTANKKDKFIFQVTGTGTFDGDVIGQNI